MAKENLLKRILVCVYIICFSLAFSSNVRADGGKTSCINFIDNPYMSFSATAVDPIIQIILPNFELLPERSNLDVCARTYNQISFKYSLPVLSVIDNTFGTNAFTSGPVTLTDGQSRTVMLTTFRAATKKDMICVQTWGLFGWQNLGCKSNCKNGIDWNTQQCTNCTEAEVAGGSCQVGVLRPSCPVSNACVSNSYSNSRNLLPITSMVMQCVSDTLQNLLYGSAQCPQNQSILKSFQHNLRNTVMVALSLYVIFFGIKLVTSVEMPKKGELTMFVLKMILVIYFSIGFPASSTSGGPREYNDGLTEYVIPLSMGGSQSLANMVIQAANSSGLCKFNASDYSSNARYSLAIWDSVDCRMQNYIGMYSFSQLIRLAQAGANISSNFFNQASTSNSQGDIASAVGSGISGVMTFPAIWLLFCLSFPVNLIFALCALFFGIFIISFSIFFIHFFIVTQVGASILIFLGPLFVPMALFKPTKQYFDGWMRQIISLSLQPMVVAGFMAVMYVIFDKVMFADCTFAKQTILGKDIFYMADITNVSEDCKRSIGYYLGTVAGTGADSWDAVVQKIHLIFFDLKHISSHVITKMLSSLVTGTLFAFLFYHFSKIMPQLAADLTGGVSLQGLVADSTAFASTALDSVKQSALKSAMKSGAPKLGDEVDVKSRPNPRVDATVTGADGKTLVSASVSALAADDKNGGSISADVTGASSARSSNDASNSNVDVKHGRDLTPISITPHRSPTDSGSTSGNQDQKETKRH